MNEFGFFRCEIPRDFNLYYTHVTLYKIILYQWCLLNKKKNISPFVQYYVYYNWIVFCNQNRRRNILIFKTLLLLFKIVKNMYRPEQLAVYDLDQRGILTFFTIFTTVKFTILQTLINKLKKKKKVHKNILC